ncbi:MAG: hypothetical protein EOS40_08060 [Mesorhizobium sp.]|nr:MAG: hypothetical protein EOQ40_08590 [Mesorhizobium sp.]RWE02311.1 MAG: hypothetical protein EOS40_08060 [Mesorhizobium sp.]TIT89037.1 MAG: hypothetical protein E5W55_25330 [Mesorhizobium sp.]
MTIPLLSGPGRLQFRWAVLSWTPVSSLFRLMLVSVSNPFLETNGATYGIGSWTAVMVNREIKQMRKTKARMPLIRKLFRRSRNQIATKRGLRGMMRIQAGSNVDATGTDISKRKWAGNRTYAPGFSG